MDIGCNLRHWRHVRAMSMAELAAAVGTTRQTVHRYESGIIANIPHERILSLARALDVKPEQLMGWSQDAPPPEREGTVFLPLLGEIACGNPLLTREEHESYVGADASLNADFCLRAKGDSMIEARINDGDIVFVRAQDTVDDGEIAAVVVEDEATLKRVYFDRKARRLVLMPANPAYAPLIYTGEELSRIRILGKAVAFQSVL